MKILPVFLIFSITCQTSHSKINKPPIEKHSTIQIDNILFKATESPVKLTDSVLFYQNITYDGYDRTVFDFFKPNDTDPSALVIMIHGGSFKSGSKEKNYSSYFHQQLINRLTSKNVAVATLNYRYVNTDDKEGMIKSLNDCKRALQFIRFHATEFNIDASKVVITGSSAGAGCALYVGLNDEMADPLSKDPVLRQSTRIQGIVGMAIQAHYDILDWHNSIFEAYQPLGFDRESVVSMMKQSRVYNLLGITSADELDSKIVQERREKLKLLNAISTDDPPIYISNRNVSNQVPTNTSELLHHPLHAYALKIRADSIGIKSQFYIPEINIDTKNDESVEDFILRIVGYN